MGLSGLSAIVSGRVLHRLSRDPASAMKLARTYARVRPTDPMAWVWYALAAETAVSGGEAERVLLRGLSRHRNDPDIGAELAELLERNGRPSEAIQLLEKLHAHHPRNARVLIGLVQVLASDERHPEALKTGEVAESLVTITDDENTVTSLIHALVGVQGAMPMIDRLLPRVEHLQDAPNQILFALVADHRGDEESALRHLDNGFVDWRGTQEQYHSAVSSLKERLSAGAGHQP